MIRAWTGHLAPACSQSLPVQLQRRVFDWNISKTHLVRDFFKREWDSLSLKAAPLPWKVTMQPNILVATKSDAHQISRLSLKVALDYHQSFIYFISLWLSLSCVFSLCELCFICLFFLLHPLSVILCFCDSLFVWLSVCLTFCLCDSYFFWLFSFCTVFFFAFCAFLFLQLSLCVILCFCDSLCCDNSCVFFLCVIFLSVTFFFCELFCEIFFVLPFLPVSCPFYLLRFLNLCKSEVSQLSSCDRFIRTSSNLPWI